VANPTTEVNAYLLRVPAGGRPFRVIEVNVYLLRVPGNVTGITNNVDTTRSQRRVANPSARHRSEPLDD
jgi:hypothetical protein